MNSNIISDFGDFFIIHWYRNTLLQELNIENSSLSFNELRLLVAQKRFGMSITGGIAFQKAWIECEIKTLEFCISRDEVTVKKNDQMFGKNKLKRKRSIVIECISDFEKQVLDLKKELEKLK